MTSVVSKGHSISSNPGKRELANAISDFFPVFVFIDRQKNLRVARTVLHTFKYLDAYRIKKYIYAQKSDTQETPQFGQLYYAIF